MRKHYFPRIAGVVFVISLLLVSGLIFGVQNDFWKEKVSFGNCNLRLDYDSKYFRKIVDTSVEDIDKEGELTLFVNPDPKLFDEESVIIGCSSELYEAKTFQKIQIPIPILSNYINNNWQISFDDQAAGITYLLDPNSGLYYTFTFGPDSSTTLKDSDRLRIDYLSKRNSKTTPIPKLRDTIE
jgi:hypothetical protein